MSDSGGILSDSGIVMPDSGIDMSDQVYSCLTRYSQF